MLFRSWGDCGYNFTGDINEWLIEWFVISYKDILSDRYTEEEIKKKLDESDHDFLMDEWDDILKDVFDVAGVCPECGELIYRDNPVDDYNYDNDRLTLKCSRHEFGCTGTLTL